MRAGGRTDMKLTVAVCNFVNAPKNFISVRYELKFYANVKLFECSNWQYS